MAKGEKPQWRLAGLDKSTGHTGNIGAGWDKPGGHISIKLNAFVNLESSKDLILTLFREKDQTEAAADPDEDNRGPPF